MHSRLFPLQHESLTLKKFTWKRLIWQRDYIPASEFKDSTLWKNIVDEIQLDLENKIRNGE